MTDKMQAAFGCFQAQDWAGAERLCVEILRDSPRYPDAMHLLGVVRLATGSATEAVSLISGALEGKPRDPVALEHLGLARLMLRDYAIAEAMFRQALAAGAGHGMLYMRLGIALASQGKLADAVTVLREAVARSPDVPDVHLNLGNTLAERGALDEAQACYASVLALQPDHPAAHFNLGNLHRIAGRLAEAESSYKRVLAVEPRDAGCHNNLGLVYEQQGRLDEAAECYRQALALGIDPPVSARNNLGNALRAQGRLDEAVACYEQAIAESPDHLDAYVNLGIARIKQRRYAEAEALYRKVLLRDPSNFDAHCNLGTLLKLQGRLVESVAQYRRALDADPAQVIAHLELGGAYRQAGDLDAALACYRTAIKLRPGDPAAHCDLAETLKLQGKLEEALVSYERVLELDPAHALAVGAMVHVRQHMCAWQGIQDLWPRVREKVAGGGGSLISPWSIMSMPTSPAEQLACARAWAQRELPSVVAGQRRAFDRPARRQRGRLKIGYLSWGFHRHATAYLTAELFELHDRGRFEVFAYAYGPDDRSEIRARIQGASEHFTDLSRESYFAAASRISDDGVDILVDLTGHTLGARPQILALRPAPVQVNWLGYPGTMGAECIDYLIADPFIIPAQQEPFYSEKVIRLPDCYQMNDRLREVSDSVPSREECGLPGDAFVFCCFNQAYKILPETFDRWMRILRGVPKSVLWLAEANRWATENLRQAAAERGVAPGRLVFASRKNLPDYLVQYRLADLALDTFPYTSHTTASDALWMGCPLVTSPGETFASRVAGSILMSAGLPELVTGSAAEYERKVLELATTPESLRDLRRRLQETRDRCPLFDTPRFVRNLESAYEDMLKALHDRGPMYNPPE